MLDYFLYELSTLEHVFNAFVHKVVLNFVNIYVSIWTSSVMAFAGARAVLVWSVFFC